MLHRPSICRIHFVLSFCVAMYSVTFIAAANAQTSGPRSGSLTFSGPVQLPGITLAAGTYTFEHVRAQAEANEIEVWSASPKKLLKRFRTAPTVRSVAGQAITFRPASAETVPAIDVWYFDNGSAGYQFLYSAAELRALTVTPAGKPASAD